MQILHALKQLIITPSLPSLLFAQCQAKPYNRFVIGTMTPIPFCNCYVGHRSGHSVCQTNIVKGEEIHFSVVIGVANAVVTERKCFWLGLSKIERFFCP